jgi:flagellar hook protein FlgE
MGTAATGGRGSVSSGAVESSNVDLATEFVSLIQHQRSFSANSKTITTADEMLQELINIKR